MSKIAMSKIAMWVHGGSGNRGCEAIVRGTCEVLKDVHKKDKAVFSTKPKEDKAVGLDKIINIESVDGLNKNVRSKWNVKHILCWLSYKLGKGKLQTKIAYRQIYENINKYDMAITIGGDVYCYGRPYLYYHINDFIKKSKLKTVFYGCSIEPKDIDNEMIKELSKYDLIIPRESITYNALKEKGINTQIKLLPDPAFQLKKQKVNLPKGFLINNTLGINMSPLIQGLEKEENITFKNYCKLIEYTLKNTDMNIALIPHVVWDNGNDFIAMKELYNKYVNTERVCIIGTEYNAMELKWIISKCRMFIGARTHSTIAAYSTCVPTLVVGYSVKARGIARDIFGSEKNMVVSVQELTQEDELVKSFLYIIQNEKQLRDHLMSFMPTYCNKTLEAGQEILKLISN